jgi:hypothetical protein
MVCLPSRNGVGASVRKNWDPAMSWKRELGDRELVTKEEGSTVRVGSCIGHCQDTGADEPEFWVDLVGAVNKNGAQLACRHTMSSLGTCNFSPYIEVPPRPVPVGSPPCTIKS